jgi:hypothetical protein
MADFFAADVHGFDYFSEREAVRKVARSIVFIDLIEF